MKKTFVFIVLLLLCLPYQAQAANDYVQYAVYQSPSPGNIQLVSYSKHWNEAKLQQLYQELLNNHYGSEIEYLSQIIIYPDSHYNVAGYYVDDLQPNGKGGYKMGSQSYIELFNADKYTTVQDMAVVLSHEYGHHYTLYNIFRKEGLLIQNWQQSGYYKTRNLSQYPNIIMGKTSLSRYAHIWDIAEIAAEDYVQLLGSPNAKKIVNFKDVDAVLSSGQSVEYYSDNMFNVLPQENLYIPLAADVSGLYEYMIGLSDRSPGANKPVILNKPVMQLSVAEVYFDKYTKYAVRWNDAATAPLHYTLVMYPEGDPSLPIPLGTVSSGGKLEVTFGSAMQNVGNGTWQVVYNPYKGPHLFRLFIYDANGFMYSSDIYRLNFDQSAAFTLYERVSAAPAVDGFYPLTQTASLGYERIQWKDVLSPNAAGLKYKGKAFSGYVV